MWIIEDGVLKRTRRKRGESLADYNRRCFQRRMPSEGPVPIGEVIMLSPMGFTNIQWREIYAEQRRKRELKRA